MPSFPRDERALTSWEPLGVQCWNTTWTLLETGVLQRFQLDVRPGVCACMCSRRRTRPFCVGNSTEPSHPPAAFAADAVNPETPCWPEVLPLPCFQCSQVGQPGPYPSCSVVVSASSCHYFDAHSGIVLFQTSTLRGGLVDNPCSQT